MTFPLCSGVLSNAELLKLMSRSSGNSFMPGCYYSGRFSVGLYTPSNECNLKPLQRDQLLDVSGCIPALQLSLQVF